MSELIVVAVIAGTAILALAAITVMIVRSSIAEREQHRAEISEMTTKLMSRHAAEWALAQAKANPVDQPRPEREYQDIPVGL